MNASSTDNKCEPSISRSTYQVIAKSHIEDPDCKGRFPLVLCNDHDINASMNFTHRELATVLGIGRARVFFHEKEGLVKLRMALAKVGIHNLSQFEEISPENLKMVLASLTKKSVKAKASVVSAPLITAGWIPIKRIKSINGGSEKVIDIDRAYNFLKSEHPDDIHPPVIFATQQKVKVEYTVEALRTCDNMLYARCWPLKNAPRSLAKYQDSSITAVVENIFDQDERGHFNIPILTSIIISNT